MGKYVSVTFFHCFHIKQYVVGLKGAFFSYCLLLFFTINSEKQSLPVCWFFCLSVLVVNKGVSYPLMRFLITNNFSLFH